MEQNLLMEQSPAHDSVRINLSLSLYHNVSLSLSAGVDHSVVYRLLVSHSGQFPRLFGRKRRQ